MIVRTTVRRAVALLAAAAVAASLAACSSGGDGGASVRVVASTDVWGNVAQQVIGTVPGVRVTSVITNPNADPHSYESTTRTALAVKTATLIITNGGGYDDFMNTLRSSTGTSATVLDAVTLSGHRPDAHGVLNEHVWYDFPTVVTVADRIADALSRSAPSHAAAFRANARAFDAKVRALEAQEAVVAQRYRGEGAAITEPVPLYMLQACGLVNRTPQKFSEAIEDGTDVPVAVLHQVEQLLTGHRVRLLAYNEQTSGPETQQVLSTARSAGVAVVPVTETLPAGDSYLTWMTRNLAAIRAALART